MFIINYTLLRRKAKAICVLGLLFKYQMIKCETLPEEENNKTGNVMQLPMDSYVCGINIFPKSSLILSYLLFTRRCKRV